MVKLKKIYCKNCNKGFYRSAGRLNEAEKFGWNHYCSKKCEYKYKTKKYTFVCKNCGKRFKRTSSNISPHNYCSQSCAAIINNKNRPERKGKIIKCKNCGKKFKKWLTGNKKYCSRKCAAEARRRLPKDLIKEIKKTARKLKRTPTRRELGSISTSCIKIFGSWNKAISAAGLPPNKSHDNRMYKRINVKSKDGHSCDSFSEVLIDDWLYKNKISHEKDAPYPTTKHKADWSIGSKKKIFIEYFGLAEDSPRYDRSITKKRTLCHKHKIKLIEIYSQDLYPKINLDAKLKAFLVRLDSSPSEPFLGRPNKYHSGCPDLHRG